MLIYQLAQIAQEEDKKRDEESLEQSLRQRTLARRSGDKSAKEPIWSAKLHKIRNKNDGSRRDAKERWNRFAGTSDGGGRGL